ncbi:hypothetical protein Pint_20115 [Pistacia integerrima]|uniref:Uncharacterized protein n=1 Tax=Pistacia integerrima TaxID=434235 RepID=A0ACC0XCG2_9ROSI|nr:hypothetical protein Pint_20115 [Pistacia integerrima]
MSFVDPTPLTTFLMSITPLKGVNFMHFTGLSLSKREASSRLKDDVASPGGTTKPGVHEFEKGGIRGILMNVVVAAAKSRRELS